MRKILLAFCLIASQAFAASITISDPQCLSFVAAANGGSLIVSCSTGGTNPAPTPIPDPVPVPQPVPGDTCAAQGLRNSEAAFDWGAGFLKQFTMSAGQSYSFSLPIGIGDAGKISTVYGGTQKVISISTNKCDFSESLIAKNCMGGGGDPGISYVAGSSRFACSLTPGQIYYVNLRNAVLNGSMPIYPIQDSCSGTCRFSITY